MREREKERESEREKEKIGVLLREENACVKANESKKEGQIRRGWERKREVRRERKRERHYV